MKLLFLVFLCWEHFFFNARFRNFHLFSCYDESTRVLSALAWSTVLWQERQELYNWVEAGKHAQLLLQLSLAAKRGDLGMWQVSPMATLSPKACPDLAFGMAPESALGSFTENPSPCKIFCPRSQVAAKHLWVPGAAWASAWLAQFVERVELLQVARLMLSNPSVRFQGEQPALARAAGWAGCCCHWEQVFGLASSAGIQKVFTESVGGWPRQIWPLACREHQGRVLVLLSYPVGKA